MRLPPRLRLSVAARRRLVEVSKGELPADLVLRGGRVLNVFTGRIEVADIGIAVGRIAWVGQAPGEAIEERELDGRVVVPGLIDPHSHLDLISVPSTFIAAAVIHGTTFAVADLWGLTNGLSDDDVASVLDKLDVAQMKLLWGLRPSLASGGDADLPQHSGERLTRLQRWPRISGTGELTAWPSLLAGDPRQTQFVTEMLNAGHTIDGHAPGASRQTLMRLAAAGLTSDHEAISGDELAARVELGYWTMVRHSSLRPDGVELAREIIARGLPTSRMMLTADGMMPAELAGAGHLDWVIRAVMEGGIDPVTAVTMATLNPAVYLGLDGHIGAVAAGRCADLVVVGEMQRFAPSLVFCDGREVIAEPRVQDGIDWTSFRLQMTKATLDAATLVQVCQAGPRLRMHGVFARLQEGVEPSSDGMLIALITRDGRSISGATVDTFDFRAVASSLTGSIDLLLMGRDPEAMLAAYRRVVEMGGGMACPGGEVSMPVLGAHSDAPTAALARSLKRFHAVSGVVDKPIPFTSQTTFLTLPALPGVCLTADGIVDVRSGTVLFEPVPLR